MNPIPAQIASNILAREGGYTDDQGGKTQFGLTLPVYQEYCTAVNLNYSETALLNISKDDAIKVYTWLYNKYGCDQIVDENVADLLFDCCFNHGPKHPIMWAQAACGFGTAADGILGPKTAQAINAEPTKVYYGMLRSRIIYYAQITVANPDADLRDLVGWMNRAATFVKPI